MRKHNEGYVLPLVLVVMVIMALIAVGVMSVSLHNLQTQKADIERMQAQYAAQGEIEKTVAQLASDLDTPPITVAQTITVKESQTYVDTIIKNRLSYATITWSSEEALDCSVTFEMTEGTAKIQCTLMLANVIAQNTEGGSTNYMVNAPQISYEAYEILYVEEVD